MTASVHFEEAKARLTSIETTATQLADGRIDASSSTMSGLAELARMAKRHLWMAEEEAVST